MMQHCRTCRCESAGVPGTEGFMEGTELYDEKGNLIDLYPPQTEDQLLRAKNPDFDGAAGIILSPCCSTAMETKADPSIALCKKCGSPAGIWNDKREGWDKIPDPTSEPVV